MTTVLNGLLGGSLAAAAAIAATSSLGADSSAASAVVESVLGDRFAAAEAVLDGRVSGHVRDERRADDDWGSRRETNRASLPPSSVSRPRPND